MLDRKGLVGESAPVEQAGSLDRALQRDHIRVRPILPWGVSQLVVDIRIIIQDLLEAVVANYVHQMNWAYCAPPIRLPPLW